MYVSFKAFKGDEQIRFRSKSPTTALTKFSQGIKSGLRFGKILTLTLDRGAWTTRPKTFLQYVSNSIDCLEHA